jgi:hypothetical protein
LFLQSASDRIIRILVVSVGIGSVLFTVLGVPDIIREHGLLNPVFSFAAIIIYCGLPPVLALIAFRAPVRVLKIAAGAHSASALVILALWVPMMTNAAGYAGKGLPWVINMIGVAACEAAIAFPFLAAWIYMGVLTLLSATVRYITFGNPDPLQAIQDAIMAFILSGFFMALLQLTIRAGREQDVASEEERTAAAVSGQQAALERRRSRYDDATRDEVVATLDLATLNTPEAREQARQKATVTLGKLASEAPLDSHSMTMPIEELDVQLRTAAVAAGISYAFNQGVDDSALEVPIEVADALVGALNEAMDNSLRHANHTGLRTTVRSVRATRLDRGIEVVMKDDGPGFNPARISVDRLGMRLNILERMAALPGARASIDSIRGRGTTVSLEWNESVK